MTGLKAQTSSDQKQTVNHPASLPLIWGCLWAESRLSKRRKSVVFRGTGVGSRAAALWLSKIAIRSIPASSLSLQVDQCRPLGNSSLWRSDLSTQSDLSVTFQPVYIYFVWSFELSLCMYFVLITFLLSNLNLLASVLLLSYTQSSKTVVFQQYSSCSTHSFKSWCHFKKEGKLTFSGRARWCEFTISGEKDLQGNLHRYTFLARFPTVCVEATLT